MNHRRHRKPYQVSCNLFPCIQMKCQDKDIKVSSPATFPSENPSIAGKNQLALDRWSLGWFCKTERHSKRTNAPKVSHFHSPTIQPWDQENYCTPRKENLMITRAGFTVFQFSRWTAKSSQVFECVGFGMIYRLTSCCWWAYEPPWVWENLKPDIWGANRKICPQGALLRERGW